MEEHCRQQSRLKQQAESATQRCLELEGRMNELEEQKLQLQQQVENQANELAEARILEQHFAGMAAEMGCIDAQGNLMRQELEEMTAELLELRASEAEYLVWFQDVKQKMAEGREEGLAMALAQNMAECKKKDRLLRQKDEEIRQLRGTPGEKPREKPKLPLVPTASLSSASGQRRGSSPIPPTVSSSSNRSTNLAGSGLRDAADSVPGKSHLQRKGSGNLETDPSTGGGWTTTASPRHSQRGYSSTKPPTAVANATAKANASSSLAGRSASVSALLGVVAQGAPAVASRSGSVGRSISAGAATRTNSSKLRAGSAGPQSRGTALPPRGGVTPRGNSKQT
eukprot:TRINITY_DN35488_c0_g1_i1.p1 TRINITY_DN35488_c0_g1~~TRINITY_DN35488_c0_g1_i1.p1  ORF type:complete len:361 (-),score=81.06 TRINITY_DN35488_c0_g1_i1:447-1466(-)